MRLFHRKSQARERRLAYERDGVTTQKRASKVQKRTLKARKRVLKTPKRAVMSRQRKTAIASVATLIFAILAVITGRVIAATIPDEVQPNSGHATKLEDADGLSKGVLSGAVYDASGDLLADDNGNPISGKNVGRTEKVKLLINFNINDTLENRERAYRYDYWDYDLTELVDTAFYPLEEVTGKPIFEGTNLVGTYDILPDNIIRLKVNNDWLLDGEGGFKTEIYGDFEVELEVDPYKVKTNPNITIELPGTVGVGDGTNGIDIPDTVNLKPVGVAIRNYVHDDQSHFDTSNTSIFPEHFKTGTNGNVSIDKNDEGKFIASYNTSFSTNAYTDNLRVTLDLSDNQTLTGPIVMTICTTPNCIHESTVTKYTIPDQFIESRTNTSVTIKMTELFEHCKESHDCSGLFEDGYGINNNPTDNGWSRLYWIGYQAELQTAADSETGYVSPVDGTYSSKASIYDPYKTTGADAFPYAESIVSYVASTPVDGKKEFSCNGGGANFEASSVSCEADSNDLTFVNYKITIGEEGQDLSNMTVVDNSTDNMVLVSSIVVRDKNGQAIKTLDGPSEGNPGNVCPNNNHDVTDCIYPDAVDSEYTKDHERDMFKFTFGSNAKNGPYTVEYRVVLTTNEKFGSDVHVKNRVKLNINGTNYDTPWVTDETYDFAPLPSIENLFVKEVTSANRVDGVIEWVLILKGPEDEGRAIYNTQVTEERLYCKTQWDWCGEDNYDLELVSVKRHFDDRPDVWTVEEYPYGTEHFGFSRIDNDPRRLQIAYVNHGEEVWITYRTTMKPEYIAAHQGENVLVTNRANAIINEQRIDASASTYILTKSANTATKVATGASDLSYFIEPENKTEGASYTQGWNRQGFHWTVTVNPDSGRNEPDYIPYFMDEIPEGLYLVRRWGGHGTTPTYHSGSAEDISQANFITEIYVRRWVNNSSSTVIATGSNEAVIPVTVDANGIIQPVDLAAPFNSATCNVEESEEPLVDCAGINGSKYEITYHTTIANEDYEDYARIHYYTNHAMVKEKLPDNTYILRAEASDTAIYWIDTAINKIDSTNYELDASNSILYEITVNGAESGVREYNDGNPMTVIDTLPRDTVLVTNPLAINDATHTADMPSDRVERPADNPSTEEIEGYQTPIVCTTDDETVIINCPYSYDTDNNRISVTVPDNQVIVIHYRVRLTNPVYGEVNEYRNTATLRTAYANFTKTITAPHIVADIGGHITANSRITLSKVDAETFAPIPGVKFALYQVPFYCGDPESENCELDTGTNTVPVGRVGTPVLIDDTYETDSDGDNRGKVIFGIADPSDPNYDVKKIKSMDLYPATGSPVVAYLYYWKELSAPSPYAATERAAEHYFIVYNDNSQATNRRNNLEAAEALARQIEALTPAIHENQISVVVEGYEWMVTNRKVANLEIVKQVLGNKANPNDDFTIEISSEAFSGDYRSYTYDVNNPTERTTGKVTFVDGKAEVTLKHDRGILIEKLPVDAEFQVVEKANAADAENPYQVSYCYGVQNAETYSLEDPTCGSDAISGTIVVGTQRVTVKNTRDSVIAGIMNKTPVIATVVSVLGVALVGFGASVIVRVRR